MCNRANRQDIGLETTVSFESFRWTENLSMIFAFILMTNILSSACYHHFLPPLKDIVAIPAVKRFFRFKKNLNQEPLRKNPNSTDLFSKKLKCLTPQRSTLIAKRCNQLLLCPHVFRHVDRSRHENGSIILATPKHFQKRCKKNSGVIRVKIPCVHRISSCGSDYPGCYTARHKFWPLLGSLVTWGKSKREKRSQMRKEAQERQPDITFWPLLGAYNQYIAEPKNQKERRDGKSIPVTYLIDDRRRSQMSVISKLSELKAKEHIAEDNRLAEMHKTQQAKREFQERIAEQLDLLSEAKRADLRAKRAFEKVVKLERTLSGEDREIHRLKETEDQLYEELLEKEAEVAMADIERIPKILNEEDLQQFMTGTKLA